MCPRSHKPGRDGGSTSGLALLGFLVTEDLPRMPRPPRSMLLSCVTENNLQFVQATAILSFLLAVLLMPTQNILQIDFHVSRCSFKLLLLPAESALSLSPPL